MKVVNYNDIFRNFISKKLTISEDNGEEEYVSCVRELYDHLLENEEAFNFSISIMYLTSYIVNYVAFRKYPDDEVLINNVNFLRSFSSVDELINIMDEDIFKTLCDDTVLFDTSCYYVRKKYIMESMNNKNFLLKMVPNFINDVIMYSMKYTPSYILNEYYKRYKETGDKNVALEDSICFGTEFLIKLEEDDIDNYKEVFYNMVRTYYVYNKYLLSNKEDLDEYAIDIMSMIESNVKDLMMFSSNNGDLLEPIVRDYLSYSLLPEDKKIEIQNFYKNKDDQINLNRSVINNPNTKIRKKLSDNFDVMNSFDEETVDYYANELETLKNSDVFDEIVSVLYIDSMSISYYNHLAFPTDEDVRLDFEYLKEFSDIKDFKMQLLENDMMLLDAISKSISFYNMSILSKKELLKNLISVNAYDSYISKGYVLDIFEFNRDYDMFDAIKLYDEIYIDVRDKKIAASEATACLGADLLDLNILDKKNYDSIIYELSKIFYEYNKYLFDQNYEFERENEEIIILMEKNLDDFLNKVKDDYLLREKIICSFYEYVSCDKTKKQDILSYFDELDNAGKVKIFSKKNKNSN